MDVDDRRAFRLHDERCLLHHIVADADDEIAVLNGASDVVHPRHRGGADVLVTRLSGRALPHPRREEGQACLIDQSLQGGRCVQPGVGAGSDQDQWALGGGNSCRYLVDRGGWSIGAGCGLYRKQRGRGHLVVGYVFRKLQMDWVLRILESLVHCFGDDSREQRARRDGAG